MSKNSMKEDGVRREEVQDPLTEASRHEANQHLNETSSEMAFFALGKMCKRLMAVILLVEWRRTSTPRH